MEVDDAVEYVGPEDDPDLFHGHPGRVWDASRLSLGEVYVDFVNGPNLCRKPEHLRPLSEAEYLRRGRRLVALTHPTQDRAVKGHHLAGNEWPEGREPDRG